MDEFVISKIRIPGCPLCGKLINTDYSIRYCDECFKIKLKEAIKEIEERYRLHYYG